VDCDWGTARGERDGAKPIIDSYVALDMMVICNKSVRAKHGPKNAYRGIVVDFETLDPLASPVITFRDEAGKCWRAPASHLYPAWCLSYHRGQGATLTCPVTLLLNDTSPDMLYVGATRARRLSQLTRCTEVRRALLREKAHGTPI